MDFRIQQRLQRVAARMRSMRLAWRLNATWLLLALIGLMCLVVAGDPTWSSGPSIAASLVIAAFVLGIWFSLSTFWQRQDLRVTAQQVEQSFPTLGERLLAAIEQRPDRPDGKFGYLQKSLIDSAVAHDDQYQWTSTVPKRRLVLAWLLNLPTLVVLLVIAGSLATLGRQEAEAEAVAASSKSKALEPVIEPGNTEVELGSSLIVTAKFPGAVPTQVNLMRAGDSQAGSQPMRRSLEDPLYAAYLTDIRSPLTYKIEYDQRQSQEFQVKVFEYPALVRADAELKYPAYTGLEAKTIVDTRRVSAVVGSDLTWICYTNKPVTRAALVDDQGSEIELIADETNPQLLRAQHKVTESRTWQLKLIDDADRTNKVEVKLSLKALPNAEPKIKLATGDVRVSPLEEFLISAKASDDFGLQRIGLSYQMAGEEPVDISVPIDAKGEKQTIPKTAELSELVAMENLQAQPDQLLSYHVWVEDRDEDNEVRRITSDMFFAEVRPFEEIFRQGEQESQEQQRQQQQQQGQGGQGGQSEELLEVQKQIVTGTWNVRRRATKSKLPDTAGEDIGVLAESQREVIELLAEKASEINVPGGEELIRAAGEHMKTAAEQLETSAESLAVKDLGKALGTAQLAYQDLLRLQAKEFEVSRSQQQQGQQSQSSRSRQRQQQLDQLKLENRENRYESERTAQEEQQEENSQLRQIQSRLRELAARQEDLNEQIRELQAALQTADTEEERKEIEKRLQRLRQQQQQMLEDADELREQLEGQQSNEALAQAQEQMEQTRENLRQSSEALNQGNTSQALASGTRAEQELKELQDKVRQESANQFSESMRQMQSEATELEKNQQELAQQLKSNQADNSNRLRTDQPADGYEQQVAQQQERLKKLMEEMKSTVEAAEDPEPLLAQRLYDTFRATEQKQTDTDLETTRKLLQGGLTADAQQLAEKTQTEIGELREGIDKAAEAVLGSEVDSLRLAMDQLQQLSRQVEQEVAQSSEAANTKSQTSSPDSQSSDSQNPKPEPHPSNSQSPQSQSQTQQSQTQQSQQSQQGQPQQGQPQQGQSQQQTPQQGQSQQGQPGQSQSPQGSPGLRGDSSSDQQPSMRSGQRESEREGQREGGRTGGDTGGAWNEAFDSSVWEGPIVGDGFREFSDRLREVEELVSDPELRSRATQIRQAARELRTDVKKHAAEPRWDLVKELVAEPLRELGKQVSEELLRKVGDKNSLVPIDRDPVPGRFNESVRRYYENLGSGR